MKNASLITLGAVLMFVLSFPLTAQSADFWGVLRGDKGKVVATCSAEIDSIGNKTFVTLNFLKGKKGHAYTAWQKHEFTNGFPSPKTINLDGTLAAGKTVNFKGHRVFEGSAFDVVDLLKISIPLRDHNKSGSVDDDTIIETISTPSFTVKGEVKKLGSCVIDLS
ncbi:MAG: hypothetical protein ACE5JU_24400 [Candidatus Binatia bacterium]